MSRFVLVTGTSRGLGRHLAEHLLRQGDSVIGCARGESTLTCERYVHHRLDLTDENAVETLVADTRRRFGCLDVLINNAGTASMNMFALTPVGSMRRVMDVNVIAPMMLTHRAIRLMKGVSSPRIVNVTSIAVPLRLEGEAVYAASKGAIETFTRVLAHEVGRLGITCNAVGPSVIRTDLVSGVPAAKLDRLVQGQAVKREGTAEDVAHVVDFFLSPNSSLVTGQVIYLGGYS